MADRHVGEPDDAVLVRAVAAGSEDALAALYDRHVNGIHAVALRLTNDRQLAEEVVQETFLALWNRAELFDPALASLATWLRTIARTGRWTGCVPRAGAHRWCRSRVTGTRASPTRGSTEWASTRSSSGVRRASRVRKRRPRRPTCGRRSRPRSQRCPTWSGR